MEITAKGSIKNVFLIAFVILSLPVGALAAPDGKPWDSATIAKVKESLRQISEAAELWEKAGGCKERECTNVNNLVAAGKLAVTPEVPAGIGIPDKGTPEYNDSGRIMGGCGPKNQGAQRTVYLTLADVSEGFCRDFNNSVGLGSIVVENCVSGGDCTASGSMNTWDFPVVKSPTFCYHREDGFVIVWKGSIKDLQCQ